MMVVAQGMALVFTGLAVGFLTTFPLQTVLAGLLFGVRLFDALSFATAAATLLVVSLVACWAPGWRAARLEPLLALRSG